MAQKWQNDPFADEQPAATEWPDHPVETPSGPIEDIARSAEGAADRGAARLLGLPGDVMHGLNWVADQAAALPWRALNRFAPGGTGEWTPPPNLGKAVGPQLGPQMTIPTGQDLVENMEAARGATYQPQTTPGRYTAAAVESAVPSMVTGGAGLGPTVARTALGAASGLASEGVGDAVKGTRLEPYENALKVAAGMAVPFAASRVITPIRQLPHAGRDPQIAALQAEGIRPTAGQVTGSPTLIGLEDAANKVAGASGTTERQLRQLNKAAAGKMGEEADLLTEAVRNKARDRLGQNYEDLSKRHVIVADRALATDINDTINRYHVKLPVARKPEFQAWVDGIVNDVRQNNGLMRGEVYQQTRSDLTRIAKSAEKSDPIFSDAMRSLRNALDKNMSRSIKQTATPEDAALWQQTNREYSNLKAVDKAMDRVGPQAATGYLSPGALKTASRSSGTPDMRRLADAAQLLKELPSSGTAERSRFFGLLGAGGGAMAGGPAGAMIGSALSNVVPYAASRAFLSRPIQGWLGNRLLDPTRQAQIQALLAAREGFPGGRSPVGLLGGP